MESKMVHNRVYLNPVDVPVRKEGESDEDFNARMEYFRKNDLRVPIAGVGMVNFRFDRNYIVGLGVINNGDDKPRVKMAYGKPTGEITYEPYAGSSFSVVEE